METPKLIIVLLVLYGVILVGFLLWRGLKKKSWKLGFKKALASLALIIGILWVFFFLITSIILLPPLIDYLDTVPLTSRWVLGTIPFFYVLTVWFVSILVFVKVAMWKPKYTDKEKEILKQERIWMKNHLGPLGKLVRVE